MSATVRVRILRAMFLGRDRVAQAGEIVDVAPLTAHDIVGPGSAELIDPARARPLIDAAVLASNVAALQIEKQGQRLAKVPLANWLVPSDIGYRPRTH